MPPLLITLLSAAMLGFLHALEVDHMIAVTAFVSSRPSSRAAAAFGARWGVGHSIAVLLAGAVLLATGLRWPERYDAWGETAVGLLLIGIGIWAVIAARRLHIHSAEGHGDHVHLHAHGGRPAWHEHAHTTPTRPHHHGHGITLVGLLHGLAGTSAVVALVPVTLIETKRESWAYLLAFGAGTTVAMTLFAVVAAGAMRHAASRSVEWGRRLSTVVGIGGILVGGWWIWEAVKPLS